MQKRYAWNSFSVIASIIIIVCSYTGMLWLKGDRQRTIFGDKLQYTENRILSQKTSIEKYVPATEQEQRLKRSSVSFMELSLGSMVFIRQLIDFGFLGFILWNGFLILAVAISTKRLTKKILSLIQEP